MTEPLEDTYQVDPKESVAVSYARNDSEAVKLRVTASWFKREKFKRGVG